MNELFEQKFREWTRGKSSLEARLNIFQRIRDMPYAVIPELVDGENYIDILKLGRGSCTPKHFLLGQMYQRLGLLVLYAVYPYRWDNTLFDYPPHLRKLAEDLPISHHLACRVEINDELVLVDATLDPPLEKVGLTVNKDWDGLSNTLLPMNPCGEEELYSPAEACLMRPEYDEKALAFYDALNVFFEKVRVYDALNVFFEKVRVL